MHKTLKFLNPRKLIMLLYTCLDTEEKSLLFIINIGQKQPIKLENFQNTNI